MARFNFGRRGADDENNEQRSAEGYEYYEDTHNDEGEYTGRLRSFQRNNSDLGRARSAQSEPSGDYRTDYRPEPRPAKGRQNVGGYSNIMVYEPRTSDDVQTVIDFLKTKESAIVNLDTVDPDVSQRILDFVSGAIYALNGSVHRIAGNIFLVSPEGVGITDNSYNHGNK